MSLKHTLTIVLMIIFGFSNSLLAQIPSEPLSLSNKLVKFVESPGGWYWNTKDMSKELFETDEIIEYLEKSTTTFNKKKQPQDEKFDEKVLVVLYIAQKFPSENYIYSLKKIIENPDIPEVLRARAILSLSSTGSSSNYIFNYLNDSSDQIRAAAFHSLSLAFYLGANYDKMQGLIDKFSETGTDYTNTITGQELAKALSLLNMEKELLKKTDLESKISFLLNVDIQLILPGISYYRAEDLKTKGIIARIKTFLNLEPQIVRKLLYIRLEKSILDKFEHIKFVCLLKELNIPLEKKEEDFFNKYIDEYF